jgi:hypothetical protein
MPITDVSPNPDHYQVGKGIVSFKPRGQLTFIDLGEVSELEFTPAIKKLEHFSSRGGFRSKDRSVAIERGGKLRVLMDEITSFNLSMLMMGTVGGTAGTPTVDILTQDSIAGDLKFVATNEIGPRWDAIFYNVEFTPSGSFNAISEEWNEIEVEGEVLVAPVDHPTAPGKFGLFTLQNGTAGGGTKAQGTLTATGNAVANETVTIGTTVYTWKAAPTTVAFEVKVGASAADSLENLVAAINGGPGAGTAYGSLTTPHGSVDAFAGVGDTMTARAKVGGTAGNSIATTETMTNASWGAATLTGGA